jgi:hypothetical protein
LRIVVSVNGAIAAHSGPVSSAKGGTGRGTLPGIYEEYEYISPELFSERIVDDFIDYVNPDKPSPYEIAHQFGTGKFYSYPKTGQVGSFSPENRAGFLALEASSVSDAIVLKRGLSHRNILSDSVGVGNSVHAFHFHLPVLSTSGQGYYFSLGLTSNQSSPDVPVDSGGVMISYTDTENSGKFVLYFGVSGTVSTSYTTVAATTGWHVLLITSSGNEASVYVDGVNVKNLTSAELYGEGNSEVFCPFMALSKITGSAARLAIVDLYTSIQSVVR